MIDIKVGQLWLDDNGTWDPGYKGEMLYVVCSREHAAPWFCMCFQEWKYGAYKRYFNDMELNKLKYIGKLTDLKHIKADEVKCNCEYNEPRSLIDRWVCPVHGTMKR